MVGAQRVGTAHSGRMEYVPDLLTLARDLREAGEPSWPYQRAADRGRLLRIHHGVYAPSKAWGELTETSRYMYRVIGAVAQSRTTQVVSHISAAVLWGAPVVGPMPQLVHVLCSVAAGTRTEHGMRKHATPRPDLHLERRGELVMSGVARMAVEVASDCAFTTAVGVIDWVLGSRRATRDELLACLDELEIRRGRTRAERAIRFADGAAGSAGESLSRVRMHESGVPAPVLQQRFEDADGFIGFVDFWWPEFDLIGEFDGVSKYVREEFRGGRSIADVVVAEKRREDRLRAAGPRVIRWGWDTAWEPHRLALHLHRSAGLPWRPKRARSHSPGA